MLCALIMAGGKGTRFWPLSTEEKPKQFLNLVGDDTMIQMTVNRILPIIPIERIFVCTGEKYIDYVINQLPKLPKENIIVEPEGRNTAPCIALSSMIIKRKFNDASVLVLPSDHLIEKEDEFRSIILKGNDFLEKNPYNIVTLGIQPNRPETGYGYIKLKDEIFNNIYKVDKFVEKPDENTAKKYLANGNYLWNSGMFLWKAENIINQIKNYSPEIYEALKEIETIEEDVIGNYVKENYKNTTNISIDYAVLEHSKDIYVIPSDIGWDDIGTWKAVERYRDRDLDNNIVAENVSVIESKSNMIVNNKKRVVLIGIEEVMTLETEDSIFIVNKKYMDNLRDYQKYVDK